IRDPTGRPADARVLDANPAFLRLIGASSASALGRVISEIAPGLDRSALATLQAVADMGRPQRVERRIEALGGWFDIQAFPTGDGRFVALFDDVTERRSAETALRESEERLRQFGEASQDVLWIRDAHTLQWIYLTPAFETIYGLDRAEALAGDDFRSWLDLVEPEDRAGVSDCIARVRAGERLALEYRIRRPCDGEVRWLRDTDFPILGQDGEVALIGGIGEDVTEARLSQERLRRSEERLQSAVEVGRLGLWDWDMLTGETHWSDEHYRMEGYAVHEIRPSYEAWAERVHPNDREDAEVALRRALTDRTEYQHEFRTRHPDGTVRWLHARGRFFYDRHDRPVRMVGAMIDTTERRELENIQRVLVGELQHRTRNLMGVVRSMAEKTARSSTDLADFRERFRDRMDALAWVLGLLSRLNEHDRICFEDLIASELEALDGNADRVRLSGPIGVRLRSSTVQTLAMALHELATNAVKYGALGQSEGRLDVSWRLEPDGPGGRPWLHIDWRERGVRMARAEGEHIGRGQGRELIEAALPYQLGARTSYVLGDDGVHCTIALPVSTSAQPTG
ncbi:MAG: PAS domain-containing protein, partial [Brevundimonas sp.]